MLQTFTHSRIAGSRPSNRIFGARASFGTPWEHQTTLMKQFTHTKQISQTQPIHIHQCTYRLTKLSV